jgi:hypothetical protein
VFALQKELARETERRYTKLSFSERLKLQLENMKSIVKTQEDGLCWARVPLEHRTGHLTVRFSVYQVSRKGGREKNEDRMGYCYTRDSGLFALADGMGGHPEGEVASQLALQTVAALFQNEAKPSLKDVRRFLSKHAGRPPPDAAVRDRARP